MFGYGFTRRDVLKTAAAAGGFALAGLPGPGRLLAQERGTGTLTASILGNLAHPHPWHMSNHDLGVVKTLLYSNLLYTTPAGELRPEVAVDLPKVSEDGLTYTFELRDDVRFHNGDKLTADDIVYTWQGFMEGGMRRGDFRPFFKEVVKENDYRVRFEFKRPWSGWLLYLNKYKAIVRKGTDPDSLSKGPQGKGSGPYTLKSFKSDVAAEFEAFPGYFEGEAPQKNIKIIRIPEAATALSNLRAGSVDIISTCPPKDFEGIRNTPGYVGATRPSAGIFIGAFNRKKPPFDNVHLRKAVAYAIDRDFICNKLYHGLVKPSSIPSVEGEFWHDPDLAKVFDYDPDKAKYHLRQAGMPSGFRFEALVPVPSAYVEVIEAVIHMQATMAEVGIDMRIRQLEFAMVLGEHGAGNYEWSPMVSMQPSIEDYLLAQWYLCDGGKPQYGLPCNPKFDEALTRAYQYVERDKRAPHFRDAVKVLVDDCTNVWVGRMTTYHAWKDNVRNFEPTYMYTMDLRKTYKI